jgi:hypothetical protein
VVVALICLSAVSSLAFADDPAESEGEEPEDTVFNFGYDPINHVFTWSTSDLGDLHDCTLENGELTATYGRPSESGTIAVDILEDGDGVVMFRDRAAGELPEDATPAGSPIEYAGSEGECGLSGAVVAGPNGQVNHGQFMKLFNSLHGGTGRGCLNRHLAESALGKDDQQVKVSDVEGIPMTETGMISFETKLADCQHGNSNHGERHWATSREKSGRPDSPGKSGSAPGHTK